MKLEYALNNYIVDYSGCWRWASGVNYYGYGRFVLPKEKHKRRIGCAAHRVFYEHYKGKIANGLVIDHLCRVRDHRLIFTAKKWLESLGGE